MRILIVTESIPFPPYNGRELPIAGIFNHLSNTHTIHLLIINTSNHSKKDKLANLPSSIHFIGEVAAIKKSKRKILIDALSGDVLFPFTLPFDSIQKVVDNSKYDFIWVSPVSYYVIVNYCIKNNLTFFKYIALGLNDSKTYLYRDLMNEMLCSKIFKRKYVGYWIKSFLIAAEEKKYLALANIVHVQTQNESDKIQKFLSQSAPSRIVIAPNGIKEELFACSYKGIDSNKILFMTHLDGGRLEESEWFIKKVWPLIKKGIPDVKLLIVGKSPKKNIIDIHSDENIIVSGYANDLLNIFESVRLTVVPTFHGTGLINRIQDAMTAGIPVVTTPQAARTFTNIKQGYHLLSARKPLAFANEVMRLYNNRSVRQTIGANGKEFAKHFPTWQQSALKIETNMLSSL